MSTAEKKVDCSENCQLYTTKDQGIKYNGSTISGCSLAILPFQLNELQARTFGIQETTSGIKQKTDQLTLKNYAGLGGNALFVEAKK
jgi:hypothetical protein